MRSPYAIRAVSDRAEWEELFSSIEQPHLSQSWAYGDAVHAAVNWRLRRRPLDIGGWRPRRLVFEQAGVPVAICQLLEKPFARVQFAAMADRGPMFVDPDPGEDVILDVYSTLRRDRRHFGLVLILIPPLLERPRNHQILREAGYRPRPVGGYRSTRVDLSLDEDAMLAKLKSKWRNQLRAGIRSGAEMVVSSTREDADWMIDRHIENMRDKGFTAPEPPLVAALYDAAPENFLVCRAVVEGESLAGLVAFTFGQAADYYIGWVSEAGRNMNVNNFLFWETALELRRRGCRSFDLGGMRAGATEPFKTGMGGREYQLIHNWLAI
jgi:hypothetical protein